MTRDEAIERAMRENMLEEVYRGYVVSYLDRPDDDWRFCCQTDCQPCMLTLGRVVDRVRALVAESPTA